MTKTPKYIYFFGSNKTEGRADMRELLGGKGANLAEMASLKINVPPGFTISTQACTAYFQGGNKFPPSLWDEVLSNLETLETIMGKELGGASDPLLVSVRSGAPASMPGMMDTVLNLGLNDKAVKGLALKTGNEWFAHDCYRRFIAMFGNVVQGIPGDLFESIIQKVKNKGNIENDVDLSVKDLQSIISQFKKAVKKNTGKEFPTDPQKQLSLAIQAVFNSWNTPRAKTYRRLNNIPTEWGTGVNVQSMVFGNMGDSSATGVAFTRNPATGEKKFFGEYMINAQGEDVVAGIRTPNTIFQLEEDMPESFKTLNEVCQTLEKHYHDMQDIEFTIQDNQLFLLQTRSGKRTAPAAIKMAVDMVNEGLISKQEAVARVPANQVDQIFHPMIKPKAKVKELGQGLGASPGAAVGKVVFTPEHALALAQEKEKIILVRMETSPEDIHGMSVAQAILTSKGGMTSHAAVVARAMGKPCVSGCGDLAVDIKKKKAVLNGTTIKEGDYISLDGTTGQVFKGQVELVQPKLTGSFSQLMSWVGKMRKLKVRANADTPHDALVAREFGAEGIGLCRTEHMFFEEDRILWVRKMILSENEKDRAEALKKLEPIQRRDFTEIFRAMEGLPVTIRLLDPPLHEFVPSVQSEIKVLARAMKISPSKLNKKIEAMKELNPMLGLRGCRLGIVYPSIYRMQVQAIMEAACKLAKKKIKVLPEIMIPLVSTVNEFNLVRHHIDEVAQSVIEKTGVKVPYKVGTMIELPRAALSADKIAQKADFFSFGTNDLTQTTFGLSRDDAGSFLPEYIEQDVLQQDPFVSVDQEGVGALVKMAIEKGRGANEKLSLGVCGEHGGDPDSIEFFHKAGLDYVSCSPYRVPTAILACAQANIKHVI